LDKRARSMPFSDPSGQERKAQEARLAELRRGIEASDWRDPDLLTEAGDLCVKLGRREEGLVLLQRALAIDRNHAGARARLTEATTRHELWEMNLPRTSDHYTAKGWEPLRYALRGGGIGIIILGGLVFGALPITLDLFFTSTESVVIVLWLLALWLTIMSIAYLSHFMQKIVYSSGTGAANAPDWPLPDLIGILWDPVKTLAVALPPLAPAFIWLLAVAGVSNSEVLTAAGFAVLLVLGMYPFPMMYLCYAMTGRVSGALSPGFILGSIRRAGPDYRRVARGWMLGALAIAGAVRLCFLQPYTGPVLGLTVMFFMLAGGRALGLVYQARHEQLDWG
jgi:hypothetical protein